MRAELAAPGQQPERPVAQGEWPNPTQLVDANGRIDGMVAGKEASKVLGAMTLLIVVIAAGLAVGAVFLIHGPFKHAGQLVRCIGCSDQSETVRSSAHQWGIRAVEHYGATLGGPLRCAIPATDANPNGRFFSVSCRGVTTAGLPIELVGAHAGIAGDNDEYLSGPWSFAIGAVHRQLSCLPSNWRHLQNCAPTPRLVG
jgi:hypothetical protein